MSYRRRTKCPWPSTTVRFFLCDLETRWQNVTDLAMSSEALKCLKLAPHISEWRARADEVLALFISLFGVMTMSPSTPYRSYLDG